MGKPKYLHPRLQTFKHHIADGLVSLAVELVDGAGHLQPGFGVVKGKGAGLAVESQHDGSEIIIEHVQCSDFPGVL